MKTMCVALRYGIAASGGIVVDGRHVYAIQRPSGVRAMVAENAVRTATYNATPQVKMIDDYLEQMMPGWKDRGVRTDAGVAESLEASLREAEVDAAEELKAPVQPDLVRHWATLGGTIPQSG